MTVALLAASSCGPEIAPPAKITVDGSPDRVARGKYLYTSVADCDSCHGERDYSRRPQTQTLNPPQGEVTKGEILLTFMLKLLLYCWNAASIWASVA